jgi:hypothetical protein
MSVTFFTLVRIIEVNKLKTDPCPKKVLIGKVFL